VAFDLRDQHLRSRKDCHTHGTALHATDVLVMVRTTVLISVDENSFDELVDVGEEEVAVDTMSTMLRTATDVDVGVRLGEAFTPSVGSASCTVRAGAVAKMLPSASPTYLFGDDTSSRSTSDSNEIEIEP